MDPIEEGDSASAQVESTVVSTLSSLKSFLLGEKVFQNFTILLISQSVILFLFIVNLLLFLLFVRNKETTRFVRNNILIFSVITLVCCFWNIFNLVSNHYFHFDNSDIMRAIRGENGPVGGRLNDLFGFLLGDGAIGLGGAVSEWVFGDGRCGDAVTQSLLARVSGPFALAFFGRSRPNPSE